MHIELVCYIEIDICSEYRAIPDTKKKFLFDGINSRTNCNSGTFKHIFQPGPISINGIVVHVQPVMTEGFVGHDVELFLNTVEGRTRKFVSSHKPYIYIMIPEKNIISFSISSTSLLCEVEIFSHLSVIGNTYIAKYMNLSKSNMNLNNSFCGSWRQMAFLFSVNQGRYRLPDISLIYENSIDYLGKIGHFCRRLLIRGRRRYTGLVCPNHRNPKRLNRCNSSENVQLNKEFFHKCMSLPTSPHAWKYQGNVNVTQSGIPCQPWNSEFPHKVTPRVLKSLLKPDRATNYCRNFGFEISALPWCYTTWSTRRIENCTVPICADITNSGSTSTDKSTAFLQALVWRHRVNLSINVVGAVISGFNAFGSYVVISYYRQYEQFFLSYTLGRDRAIPFMIDDTITRIEVEFELFVEYIKLNFTSITVFVIGQNLMELSQFPDFIDYMGPFNRTMRHSRCLDWTKWFLLARPSYHVKLPEGDLCEIVKDRRAAGLLQNRCRNSFIRGSYNIRPFCYVSYTIVQLCAPSSELGNGGIEGY